MLMPLQRQGTLKVWADTDIRPGQLWKEEIKQALAKAKVAVLLVSSDFLASRFIHAHELPPLLEAASKEGLTILWIPLRPCLYEETEIEEYQAAYNPATPLSSLSAAQQEIVLAEIARKIKSARLTAILEPPPPQPDPSPRVEPKPPANAARPALPAIQYLHGWSAQQVQELQRQTAQALGLAVEFRDKLKDGSQGPLMVVIPGGRFLMGSPTDEPGRNDDERQHEVEVAPFAIGKYTVTFEEYDRFAEVTRRDKPADQGWGRGRRPVIKVTWFDAVAYADWLSQQTGHTYRLLTEAEWEYTCRAGTTTPFYFGTTINTHQANYCSQDLSREKTVEVDSFPANAWGLHEMHGNVGEWTCSEYDKDYSRAALRCVSDAQSGSPRVLRGGSWLNEPKRLRGAARNWYSPHFRLTNTGVRLARTFP